MNENVTKALTVIDNAKKNGALAFVTREDCMSVTPLYKPEVTIIQLKLPKAQNDPEADVYNIQGKFMPKREIVDRIGEATGLEFIREGCRSWTETREDDVCGKRTVYISEQQAKKRMSDGSYRTSSVQAYEFDPVLRAMDDFNVTEMTPEAKNMKNRFGKTLGKAILEYTKVARQRAETGARLRVIRELTNMPTAFSKAEAEKPLIFGRIAQNTDYILQTPEGRAMASAQALGVDVASLFGGRKLPVQETETPAPAIPSNEPAEALPETTEVPVEYEGYSDEGAEAAFDSPHTSEPESTSSLAEQAAGAAKTTATDVNEFDALTQSLKQWISTYKDLLDGNFKNGVNPYQIALDELDENNFNASVESRKLMIQRVKDFLKARGVSL